MANGDTLTVFAEVQATTTCVDRTERCIGRPYDFSPFISAKLAITAGRNVTGGGGR